MDNKRIEEIISFFEEAAIDLFFNAPTIESGKSIEQSVTNTVNEIKKHMFLDYAGE